MSGKPILTDKELLAELERGQSSKEIAAKWGISVAAVNKRRQRLRFEATTIAVVARSEAHQLIGAELDVISLLQICMQRLMLLSDAYHEWLLDPAMKEKEAPKYFIGPRATEIEVVYTDPGTHVRNKATLQSVLDRVEPGVDVQTVERKCADPRVELRNTVQSIGGTVAQMVELAAMLADVRAMQVLRDSILEELRKVDAEVAARIVSALRSRLVVGGVPGGASALDSGERSHA